MTDQSAELREGLGTALEVRILSPGSEEPPPLARVLALMADVHDALDIISRASAVKRSLKDPFSGDSEPLRPSPKPGNFVETFVRHWDSSGLRIARLSMNSPLVMDLVVTGASSASVVSAAVYLFKNPTKIGEWFPKLQTSWYNGRAEAEKAKKAYEKLRKARTEMRELQR